MTKSGEYYSCDEQDDNQDVFELGKQNSPAGVTTSCFQLVGSVLGLSFVNLVRSQARWRGGKPFQNLVRVSLYQRS